MKYSPFICSFVLIISSCSTAPVYKPVVDPNSITDKNYIEDYELCEKATDQIDYSNEENQAAIRGGLAGLGVVGAGAIATGLTGSGDLGALDPNKPVSSFVRFRIPVPLCSVGFWLPFWWLKMICKAMYLIFILFILLCTSSFNHDREHPRRLQQHTR